MPRKAPVGKKPKVQDRKHVRPDEARRLIEAAGKRGRYPFRDTIPGPHGLLPRSKRQRGRRRAVVASGRLTPSVARPLESRDRVRTLGYLPPKKAQ